MQPNRTKHTRLLLIGRKLGLVEQKIIICRGVNLNCSMDSVFLISGTEFNKESTLKLI